MGETESASSTMTKTLPKSNYLKAPVIVTISSKAAWAYLE